MPFNKVCGLSWKALRQSLRDSQANYTWERESRMLGSVKDYYYDSSLPPPMTRKSTAYSGACDHSLVVSILLHEIKSGLTLYLNFELLFSAAVTPRNGFAIQAVSECPTVVCITRGIRATKTRNSHLLCWGHLPHNSTTTPPFCFI
jgi:hypothetical protein